MLREEEHGCVTHVCALPLNDCMVEKPILPRHVDGIGSIVFIGTSRVNVSLNHCRSCHVHID